MTKKLVFGRKMLYLCSAIKGLNDMRQIINHLYLIIVVLIMGSTGCGDTTDEAQTDKEFDQ